MADKQIKALSEETSVNASDLFIMQKASSDATSKIKAENIVPASTISADKLTSQESWIAATMQNSWVAYDASIYYGAYYMKDHMGFVHLRGLIKNGSSATAIMFTLPAGYRPEVQIINPNLSANAICRVDVKTNGEVYAPNGAVTTWVNLSNIIFKAA